MIHLAGFCSKTAVTTIDQFVTVPAMLDGYLAVSNDAIRLPRQMRLVWHHVQSFNLRDARIVASQLRDIGPYYLQPISRTVNSLSIYGVPFRTYGHDVTLLQDDEISVEGMVDDSGDTIYALLLLGDGNYSVPSRRTGILRFFSNLNGPSKTWVQSKLTPLDQIPSGRYMVIGGVTQWPKVLSGSPVAWRLVFDGQISRPGAMTRLDVDNPISPMFRCGSLGVWGTFSEYSLPYVECFHPTSPLTGNILLYLDVLKM